MFENASKARADVRSAIEWARRAWEALSVETIKNCWNHARILPRPVAAAGPGEAVETELAALLLEFAGSQLAVNDVVADPTETWTASPVEYVEEDAALRAALEAQEESDKEEADDSVSVIPMTLKEARSAAQGVKVFVQENQDNVALRPYLVAVEGLVSEMEAMTVSARTRQSDMREYFIPVPATDGVSPSAGGARAD